MGIFGYASFGDATDREILENFSGTHSSDAFNILLVVHLILYIPVDFVIMRGAFQKLSRIGGTLRSSELVDGKKQVYLPAEIHAPMTVLLLAATCAVSLLLRYGGLTKGQAFSLVSTRRYLFRTFLSELQ